MKAPPKSSPPFVGRTYEEAESLSFYYENNFQTLVN